MNHYAATPRPSEGKSGVVPRDASIDGIDVEIGGFGHVLRRNWKIIALIVVLALAVGAAVSALSPRLYRASATVQIEQQLSKVLSSDEEQPSVAQDSERFLQTQLSLLNSRALAARVVDQLNVDETMPVPEDGPRQTPRQRRESAINMVQEGLSVTLPRDSRVAEITWAGREPQLVADVANAYAENFIGYNLERRFGESSYARRFLERELAAAKARLEASESQVVNYARANRLVDTGGAAQGGGAGDPGSRLLTTNSMLDVNAAFARAQINRIEAERRWRQAANTPAIALPEVMANPAIQQLLQQRAQAVATYDRDRQSFKAEFPAMQEAKAQIGTLDSQTQRLADAVRTSLRNNYLLAMQQESALNARLEALKSETLNEQGRSIEYNILRREADTNRVMYDGLLQRFKEVSAAAGITANNISVVDKADRPDRPFSPNTRLNLLSSLFGGFALAFLFVLVRTRMDNTIRTPEDVTAKTGLQLLGTVPSQASGASALEMLEGSSVAEAFWSLRTSIGHVLEGAGSNSFLLTSARGREGKSTTSFGIAHSFALAGRKVALVDADLRKPAVHRMLELGNNAGLASVIVGESILETSLQTGTTANMKVLTSGPLTRNPAQLLAEARLAKTIHQLEERFELTIIDSPPVLGLADAVLLASHVGVVLMVIEADKTQARQVKDALKRLNAVGVTVGGAILNKYNRNAAEFTY